MGRFAKAVGPKHRNDDSDGLQAMTVSTGDSSRIVVLHGDVNEQSISMVVAQMLHFAGQNHKPIHLIISTYGGSVDEMFTLYDTIKFLPCPVHTIALGKVMSAGVLLLASGTKGRRMIGKSARIMIHPISGAVGGNIFEVVNGSEEYKRIQALMVNAMAKETKTSRSDLEKLMKSGHDVYILPEQAVKMGIVDKIIGDAS
jgi:ATP-dependent Clp protease protease subunit